MQEEPEGVERQLASCSCWLPFAEQSRAVSSFLVLSGDGGRFQINLREHYASALSCLLVRFPCCQPGLSVTTCITQQYSAVPTDFPHLLLFVTVLKE